MTDAGKDYFEHVAVSFGETDNGEFFFWLNFRCLWDQSMAAFLNLLGFFYLYF